jgi:N-acetylneuraminic acid mutarotase
MKSLILFVALACCAFAVPRFQVEPQSGYIPSYRGSASMVAIKEELILFGGYFECFNVGACEHTWYNDTYHYDLATSEGVWNIAIPEEVPGSRAYHGAVAYEKRGTMIIYGGTKYNAAFSDVVNYDDMWEYFPQDALWVKRTPKNSGPGARVGPGLVIRDDTMYFFGGLSPEWVNHNDFWSYNLKTDTWSRIHDDSSSADVPIGRYLQKMEIRDEKIYMFSGNLNPNELGVQLADCWVYDLGTRLWEKIPTPSGMRSRVHGASAITSRIFMDALGDTNDDLNECKVNQISGGQNPTRDVDVYHFCGPEAGWKAKLPMLSTVLLFT